MDQGEKPGARSDFAQAIFWLAAGGLIFYGAWTMDRLEKVGVQPFSAPGLLPGILGVFIALLGASMLVRALRAGALRPAGRAAASPIEWRRVLLPLALCLASKGELGRLALVALAVGAGAGIVISLIFQEVFLIRLP
jgi:hypothetical protein